MYPFTFVKISKYEADCLTDWYFQNIKIKHLPIIT